MTEPEALYLQNILAGVDEPTAAQAAGLDLAEAEALTRRMLHLVGEYQACGDVPFFPCATLDQARAHRLKVMDVLGRAERWDKIERPMLRAIWRGRPRPELAERFGAAFDGAERLLRDTVIRLAAHVPAAEQPQFRRGPAAWIKANLARALDLLDRFPSWDQGRQFQTIEFQTITSA
jgi:hypothetical protein